MSPSPVSSPLSLPSTSSDQPGPSFVPSPASASPTLPHLLDHDYFQFPPSPAHSTSSSSSLSGLSSNSSNTCRSSSSKTISPPSEIELNQLFDRLAQCKSRPSILALSRNHSSLYVPLSLDQNLPSPLSQLYDPENLNLNYMELLELADNLVLSVTPDQCTVVEANTRDQSKSRLWFNMRTGRVTASRLRAVCKTDDALPSLSLIIIRNHPILKLVPLNGVVNMRKLLVKSILYCLHSPIRILQLVMVAFLFTLITPISGASPDGVVNCTSCGQGICEIKVCYSLDLLIRTFTMIFFSAHIVTGMTKLLKV